MAGYSPIGLNSSQSYTNYHTQIARYKQLLAKEIASDDSNSNLIYQYQSDIVYYQKLQRKVDQKELLRSKTHPKGSELKNELKSFKASQQISAEALASTFNQPAKADYRGIIEGQGSDKFQLTLADISLETKKLDSAVREF